jgi:hypothetical protein
MSQRFYYWNPMDIDRYDLIVNTGVLDLDTAVDVIVAAYQAKAARATQAISLSSERGTPSQTSRPGVWST